MSRKLAVFGVPSAAGAAAPGVERGPFALREAGLLDGLGAAGSPVVNLSDLSLFPFREDEADARPRNAEVAACAVRAAADETTRALDEGFVLALGGDSLLALGLAAGVRRREGSVALVQVSGIAGLLEENTSGDGRLDGMSLALALGWTAPAVARAFEDRPAVEDSSAVLVGFGALDAAERASLGRLALALPASAVDKLGGRAAAALVGDALAEAEAPLVVHVHASVRPGLGLDVLADLVTALVAAPRCVALGLSGYDPSHDEDGTEARAWVDLLVRAWQRRRRVAR